MPGARNPFTDDDDDLLVKFVAKYNPDIPGRKGNSLYQTLAANEKRKWSWSARHPWQSWRERYVKKQDWFDAQIKRYQKRHGIKAENPVRVRKRKPTAVREEEEEEGEEEEEEEEEEEYGSNDEEVADSRGKRKRTRASEGTNAKGKRRRVKDEVVKDMDKGESGSRDVKGGHKEDQEALVESFKLQEVDGGQTDADEESGVGEEEESEEEDEERRGPVGSDDYTAELFQEEEEEVDQLDEESPNSDTSEDEGDDTADAVVAMLMNIGPMDDEKKVEITTDEEGAEHQPLYPDITSLPSPHLHPVHIPGTYDTSTPRLAQHVSPPSTENSDIIKRESTSPVSRPNSTTNATVRSLPYSSSNAHRKVHNEKATTSSARLSSRKKQPSTSSNDSAQRMNGSKNIDQAYRTPKRTRRRPRSPNPEDSDFFDSIPPSPRDSGLRAKATRQPPRLLEGPFRNVLVGRRRREDDAEVSEREQWPPVRRTRVPVVDNGKGKAREDEEVMRKADREVKTENLKAPEAKPRNIFPRQPQVNAIASSSRSPPNSHIKPDPSTRPTLNLTTSSSHHPFSQASEPPLLLPRAPNADSKPTARPIVHPIDYRQGPAQGKGAMVIDLTSPVEAPHAGIVKEKKTAKIDRLDAFREIQSTHAIASAGVVHPKGIVVNRDEGQVSRSRPPRPQAGRDKKPKVSRLPDDKPHTHGQRHVSGIDEYRKPLRGIPTGPSEIAGPSTSGVPLFRQENDIFSILSRPGSVTSYNDPFVDDVASYGKEKRKGKDKAGEAVGDKRRHTIGGGTTGLSIQKIDLRPESKRLHSRRSLPSQTQSNVTLRSSSSRRSTPSAASPISMAASDRNLIERLGVMSAIELISRNHGFQEEVTWNLFRQTRSVTGTDKVMRSMRMRLEAIGSEELAKWVDQYGTRQIQEVDMDMDEPDYGSPSDTPDKSSMASPPRRSTKHGLRFTPTSAHDDVSSDYSPPKTSRAGQFARLVKQGRIKEALKREERRASGGGLLPPKIGMAGGSHSPEADNSIMGRGQVELGSGGAEKSDVTASPEDLDVQGPSWSSTWGKKEDQMFMSASSGNEAALREIEAAANADFIRQQMAYLISELICD